MLMIDQCFACKNFKELTVEHIIPQALGGRIKARLYCKNCNDTFGHELDDTLSINYGKIGTLLNIKRERGDPQPFDVIETSTQIPLVFTGNSLSRKKPTVILNKSKDGKNLEFADVTARTQKELEKIKATLKERYEMSDSAEQKTFREDRPGPIDANFQITIDDISIRRAISKIAYSFLCTKISKDQILSSSFNGIRNYIKDGTGSDLASANYVHTNFMTDYSRPLHKIHIALNRGKFMVVGFVMLFGIYRFSVLLSDTLVSHLDWPDLDYTFDPVRSRDVYGNDRFRVSALTKDNMLRPKQSKKFVFDELNIGFKMLENYVEKFKFVRSE
jgi:hypothetical protein